MQAPEEHVVPWRKKFQDFEDVKGKYGGAVINNPVAAFAGMMTILDHDVGRILDLLNELGIAKNTLVIFTSDNGPHKEGGHQPDFFDSNGPLRGYKRDLYEGGIRVATTAWWPSVIKPSSTSSHIGTGWDVLPTFCELAGDACSRWHRWCLLRTLLSEAIKASRYQAQTRLLGIPRAGRQASNSQGQLEGRPSKRSKEA